MSYKRGRILLESHLKNSCTNIRITPSIFHIFISFNDGVASLNVNAVSLYPKTTLPLQSRYIFDDSYSPHVFATRAMNKLSQLVEKYSSNLCVHQSGSIEYVAYISRA